MADSITPHEELHRYTSKVSEYVPKLMENPSSTIEQMNDPEPDSKAFAEAQKYVKRLGPDAKDVWEKERHARLEGFYLREFKAKSRTDMGAHNQTYQRLSTEIGPEAIIHYTDPRTNALLGVITQLRLSKGDVTPIETQQKKDAQERAKLLEAKPPEESTRVVREMPLVGPYRGKTAPAGQVSPWRRDVLDLAREKLGRKEKKSSHPEHPR